MNVSTEYKFLKLFIDKRWQVSFLMVAYGVIFSSSQKENIFIKEEKKNCEILEMNNQSNSHENVKNTDDFREDR